VKVKERVKYAVDASVILKWFTQDRESDLEKALQLRKDFKERKIDLICPELLIYEIANVLRYKESIEEKLIIKAIQSIYEMKILMPVNKKIMENAIRLARKYGITVYDSTYLSFAHQLGCDLITADKKLFQKIKDLPGVVYIVYIEEIASLN